MGAVDVKQAGERELVLEWDSSASNDMIADSTLALITGIDHSPASVKRNFLFLSFSDTIRSPMIHMTVTTHSHSHSHSHAPEDAHPHADVEGETGPVTRIRRLAMFLEAHFGDVELHMPDDAETESGSEPALLVRLDEADAVISLVTLVSVVSRGFEPKADWHLYRLWRARASSSGAV